MRNELFSLNQIEQDELVNHFDSVCDLLEKRYGCDDCPFNDTKVTNKRNFECKLDKIIEDVRK